MLEELLGLNPRALDERFRGRELWSRERVEAPLAVRLDGVSWGRRLRGAGFKWPRDERVHRALTRSVLETIAEQGGDMAYVTSDEASILFLGTPPYSGRVEKLDSVYASSVAARISVKLGLPLPMDGRVVKLRDEHDAALYILYRARIGLNNYVASVYHSLHPGRATPSLREMLDELPRELILEEPWRSMGSCVVRLPSARVVDGIAVERRRLAVIDTPQACLDMLLGGSG